MVAAWMLQGASDLRLPPSTVVTDIFGAVLEPRDGLLTLTDSPVYIHGLGPQGLDLGERVNLGTLGSTPKQSTR